MLTTVRIASFDMRRGNSWGIQWEPRPGEDPVDYSAYPAARLEVLGATNWGVDDDIPENRMLWTREAGEMFFRGGLTLRASARVVVWDKAGDEWNVGSGMAMVGGIVDIVGNPTAITGDVGAAVTVGSGDAGLFRLTRACPPGETAPVSLPMLDMGGLDLRFDADSGTLGIEGYTHAHTRNLVLEDSRDWASDFPDGIPGWNAPWLHDKENGLTVKSLSMAGGALTLNAGAYLTVAGDVTVAGGATLTARRLEAGGRIIVGDGGVLALPDDPGDTRRAVWRAADGLEFAAGSLIVLGAVADGTRLANLTLDAATTFHNGAHLALSRAAQAVAAGTAHDTAAAGTAVLAWRNDDPAAARDLPVTFATVGGTYHFHTDYAEGVDDFGQLYYRGFEAAGAAGARRNLAGILGRYGVAGAARMADASFSAAVAAVYADALSGGGRIGVTTTVDADGDTVENATGRHIYDRLLGLADGSAAFEGGGRTATSAVSALNGAGLATAVGVDLSVAREILAGPQRRLDGLRRDARAAADAPVASPLAQASRSAREGDANGFWLDAFGLWEDAGARRGRAGYRYESGGFHLGYDRRLGPWTLGAAFGYNRGDYEDKAALSNDGDLEYFSATLYGEYAFGDGFFARAAGGYAWGDHDLKRTVDLAGGAPVRDRADFDSGTWSADLRLGYDWRPTERLTLTPVVGFTYLHARADSFTSTLIDTQNRFRGHSARLPFEVTAAYAVDAGRGRWTAWAKAGYAYELRDRGISGSFSYVGLTNSPVVTAFGREPGRHALNAGAGLRYERGRYEVSAEYGYQRRAGDLDAHRADLRFSLSF